MKDFVWLILTALVIIFIILVNQYLPIYLQIPIASSIYFFVPISDNSKLKDTVFTDIKSIFIRWLIFVLFAGIIGLVITSIHYLLPNIWVWNMLTFAISLMFTIFIIRIVDKLFISS